ncbi:hypothetical protein DFH06DRAFT_1145598 [Mycena polygramma]|nr:hypothetical protein DFH06DRAFT_1145598 [Mycena polygramma]
MHSWSLPLYLTHFSPGGGGTEAATDYFSTSTTLEFVLDSPRICRSRPDLTPSTYMQVSKLGPAYSGRWGTKKCTSRTYVALQPLGGLIPVHHLYSQDAQVLSGKQPNGICRMVIQYYHCHPILAICYFVYPDSGEDSTGPQASLLFMAGSTLAGLLDVPSTLPLFVIYAVGKADENIRLSVKESTRARM